jgi:predicted kinase
MRNKNTIWITVGLQASGKTSWSKELVKSSNGRIVNICKDDLREMLHNSEHSKGRESFVISIQEAIIDNSLNSGKDCVISDTNLNPAHIDRIKNKFGDRAEIVIEDCFLQVSLEECIARDKNRTKSVGEKVIRDTYNRWIRKDQKPKEIDWDFNKKTAICFDIDGTLTLGPKDRSAYEWHKVGQDDVNVSIRSLAQLHHFDGNNTIIIVSGRDAVCRPETEKWLKDNYIPYHYLFMRKEGDNRPDDIVKEEIIDNNILPEYNIKLWIDDRLKVCRMVYRKGISLLRVGDPDADF